MRIYLDNSNIFANFGAWIGGSCKPSDKGKLTAFPRFNNCQHKSINVSSMLSYEELPEINSPRWLSLEDLEGEIWKDVVGYEERLAISNYGRIKRKSIEVTDTKGKVYHYKEKIYKQRSLPWSHQIVIVSIALNKTKGFLIHRAVAQAFIPNPNNFPFINHKDVNPKNNTVSNLEWCTALYNSNYGGCRDKIKMSKVYNGIANSIILYDINGDVLKKYNTEHEAEKDLGISRCIINSCCNGKYLTACGLYLRFACNDKKIEKDLDHSYYIRHNEININISSLTKEKMNLLLKNYNNTVLCNNVYLNGKRCVGVKNMELITISNRSFLRITKGRKKAFIYLKE